MDDTPSADDAPNDDRNHPRRRRPHDLDLDERSLERRLGAHIRRLLRQRRIAGACLCVVKVPMDPRASREDIDGGIREYSRVYGVASLDVPRGTGALSATEVNATSKAPGRDDENVKKRMANNYGEEVDPRVTLFDVGSCAKIFPAIAIARESGIDLDDDADDHLPTELAVASMATNASNTNCQMQMQIQTMPNRSPSETFSGTPAESWTSPAALPARRIRGFSANSSMNPRARPPV